MITFKEFLFESAPRIPNDEEYWKNKGKSGKNVCIIFHDDMDGIVSAILMKNYLLNKGFKIKKYAIINYQESWEALQLDPKLINIALDYAEDAPDVDVYMDHHGSFEENIRLTQKRHAIKTQTGSAAEGIADQLGIPFPKEIKDWIDMIDSAKYSHYEVDIKDILNFDLKTITKDENSKLRFASAFNQLIKRSDFTTFIEVVNASNSPSIFNIYRLFKIFFPKNNPNWKTGVEAGFVSDAEGRLDTMQHKTRGKDNSKERWLNWRDFWNAFVEQAKKPKPDGSPALKLKLDGYQIIGNLMFVPSGTWANALRAKAIFIKDRENGIIPNDTKLNFVLLQYGNTLQIADLDERISNMKKEDLPVLKNGEVVDNLGKYMSGLVVNFGKYLGYHDERTKDGGHDGIGTISNIFGKCSTKGYEDVPFLDLYKNKIISDISGIEWPLTMPWNDEEKKPTITEDELNFRMLDDDDIVSEKDALEEKEERKYLSFVSLYDEFDIVKMSDFKLDVMKKVYKIIKNNSEILYPGTNIFDNEFIEALYFTVRERDEKKMLVLGNDMFTSGIFDEIVDLFGFNKELLYKNRKSDRRSRERKQLKRIMVLIGNILRGDYISDNREKYYQEYKKWKKSNS